MKKQNKTKYQKKRSNSRDEREIDLKSVDQDEPEREIVNKFI